MWNLKYDINELPWNRNRLTDIETDSWLARGRGVGEE